MQKIVINRCYGGYGLSPEAAEFLGIIPDPDCGCYAFEDDRSNPQLVKCVETLGEKANDFCSYLKVVEIPDGVEWEIEQYDGIEWVAEKHRTWR